MAAREIPLAIVRCPYCVDGNDFRMMIEISVHCYICQKCGHMVSLSESDVVCGCMKCLQLRGKVPVPHPSL
jgi:Zn ribbon nucleic-acid-binding protein